MRMFLTFLMAVFCLSFAFASTSVAHDAPAQSLEFTIVAGAFSSETPSESSFGDDIGFGGGVMLTFSDNLAVLGLYEYLKSDVDTTETVNVNELSVYGAITLFDSRKTKLSGLLGFEWMAANFGDFEFDDPNFAFGLMGQLELTPKVALYVAATTTLMDNTELFDIIKGRAGLNYTF